MPPRRQRRAMQRTSYAQSSSEDISDSGEDYNSDHLASSSPVAIRKRSRRLAFQSAATANSESPRPSKRPKQRTVSYKEDSTDDEEFNERVTSDREAGTSRPRGRERGNTQLRTPPQPRRRNDRLMRAAPVQKVEVPQNVLLSVPFYRKDGMLYWDTLPFHVLEAVLDFATFPLNDPNSMVQDKFEHLRWLVGAARVCKSWYNPAVNVLYRSPTFRSAGSIYTLASFLETQPSYRPSSRILDRELNHNFRIKKLEIDVSDVLAYAAHLRGRFELGTIIPLLPRLDSVILTNKFETPEARQQQIHVKWTYQDSLFGALNKYRVRLKRFQWSETMLAKSQTLQWMAEIHSTDSFQSIKELKLMGFEVRVKPKKKKVNRNLTEDVPATPGEEELLAEALQALPNLKKLEFESCPILNEILLPLLPQHLETLVVNNCHYFDSAMLSAFLSSHGSQLKTLRLSHNKALEISFLTILKSACPALEILCMDLNNYNSHRTYADSKPIYNNILVDDEMPTWPSSLQKIEMLYLRHWTDAAAINFLRSLVDSANWLPHLRILRLKAILAGLGWRQRISFREEWTSRLQRVFLRNDPEPNPHFKTIADGQAWLDKQRGTETQGQTDIITAKSDSEAPLVACTQKMSLKPRNGRMLRPRRKGTSYSEDSDDETQSAPISSSSLAEAVKTAMEKHIQGLCHVVDVTIDNLRPAEKQYNEADFLDSEPEDDGEWNGKEEGEYFDSWAS